jgi:uncharacterized protein involved in response to NO
MQIQEPLTDANKPPFWETFTAAPHRMMFFAGAVQLILPLFIWSIEIMGRYTELWKPLDTLVPATWAHGFIMLYGVFTFFIFGFLMTVYPRWMNGTEINKDSYIATFALLSAGILMFETGLFYSISIATIGLITFLLGWALGGWALYKVFRDAPSTNKHYEIIINIVLVTGWISAASFLAYFLTGNWVYQAFSLKAGIWLFLLPLLFTVAHRMLPFFSSNIIPDYKIFNPRWTLHVMLICSAGHLLLDSLHFNQWLFLTDLPLAFVALLHSFKWRFFDSFNDRLVAVLHMAFLWLGIGMLLFSLQSILLLMTNELILNKAPLHALSIGFFSSLLIAMASRVSLGHSGRMLILDNTAWILFLGLQLAAIARILADSNFENSLAGYSFNIFASLIWLICLSVWFVRFAPFYLTRRADGRTG